MPDMTSHPSHDQLNAYNLGQLSPEETVAIENHISECEPCCDTIISLSSDDTFVGLLKEARQSPTDQTLDHDSLGASSFESTETIPRPLAEHPRYEVVRLVGKGGMGRVYKARHRMMDRPVALKVINREWIRKAEVIDRFHREVKTAASLDHPNIVTSHDAEQADDLHFLVMEFVNGVDLSETVKQRGPLPIAEACDYIRQAAEGLQHAHDRGMVHRDIKPHNLMVTQDKVVKILDFGLASLTPQATPDQPISEDADGNLTIAGAIMGTPDFISPEQAQDACKVDGRSDIYSLGMTLYYLLAGRAPFGEGSAIEKLKKHAEAEPESLEQFRDDILDELQEVFNRMTAKSPKDRFQSPNEVAEALQPFVNQLATVSKPRTSRQRIQTAGGSIFKWIGGIVLLAMLGAGGLFLLNLSDPETDYKNLDKFLSTGVSDEPADDIVRRLLRKEAGRRYLRKLDSRHRKLAYTEGQFARGYTSVAAFACENRITGVAQSELRLIGWSPTTSGMMTCSVHDKFTVDAIDFDNAPDNTCLATLQFRTPKDERLSLGLKAHSVYEAEIPLKTLIEGEVSTTDTFRNGKFVRTAPADSGKPKGQEIVPESIAGHQTDVADGVDRPGLDMMLEGAIRQAAGIPRDQWESVAKNPVGSTSAIEGEPLSMVLLKLQPDLVSKTNLAVLNDFRWTKGIPRPSDLHREMSRSIVMGKVSMLKPDRMNGLTYKTITDGDNPPKLIGSVCFDARGLYSGKVEFVAELEKNNEPKIIEFRLPNYGLSVVRLENGNWKSRDLETGVNAYKRPFDYDLTLVPADVLAVYGYRPHQIHQDDRFNKILETLEQNGPNTFLIDGNLDQVLMLQWANEDRTYSQGIYVLTVVDGTARDFARQKLGVATNDSTSDAARWEYYPVEFGDRTPVPKKQFVRFVDDKTLVLSSKEFLDAHQVALKTESKKDLSSITSSLPDSALWVIGNTSDKKFVDEIKFLSGLSPLATTLMTQIPIWEDTSHLALSLTLDDFPTLQLSAHALSADRQKQITQTAKAVPVTLANLLRASSNGRGPVDADTIGALINALNGATVTEPSNTETRISVSLKEAEPYLFRTLNSYFDFEETKRRAFNAASVNNLRQIGMAIMLFEQEHGYLPSVTTNLPGAKHPVSWRVAILKYLDESLYKQYKLDEPWDSDHNKAVLQEMPEVYRHPNQEKGMTNTCYVTPAGLSTATGDGDATINMLDGFTDPPQQTILVTEGFTHIPWTKPEDLNFGDETTLPSVHPDPNGWNVIFVDGSTHFISSETSNKVLQALITRNGDEVIENKNGVWKKVGETSNDRGDETPAAEASEDQPARLSIEEQQHRRDQDILNFMYESNPELQQSTAESFIARGDYEGAKRVLSSVQPADPKATAALKIAKIQEQKGEIEMAADSTIEAIRLTPSLLSDSQLPLIKKAGRVHLLVEVLTEERLLKLGYNNRINSVVKALLDDDATRADGFDLLARLSAARSLDYWRLLRDVPQNLLNENPDPALLLRKTLIPTNFAAESAGWERFGISLYFSGEDNNNYKVWGPLQGLPPIIQGNAHKNAALNTVSREVENKLEQHPGWKAGVAVLGYLQAELGNEQQAVALFEKALAEQDSPMPPNSAWAFALVLEDKGKTLDQMAMRLYERKIAGPIDNGRPWRYWPSKDLADLYAKYGRRQEARELLFVMAEPENEVICTPGYKNSNVNSCVQCHKTDRSFSNFTLLSSKLSDIGYPVDAYLQLARIDASYHNLASSDTKWANQKAHKYIRFKYSTVSRINFNGNFPESGRYLNAKTKAVKGITPSDVLDALKEGRFTNLGKYNGDLDLAVSVRGEGGKPTVFSPVVELFALATQTKGDQAAVANVHIDQFLSEAFEKDRGNIETGIAATIFAFLREDIEEAKKRTQLLSDSIPRANFPPNGITLWLVARYALANEGTKALGELLAHRALAEVEGQSDPLWKDAIQQEWQAITGEQKRE